MQARAKVFRDDKGNRMLFPAYIYRGDDEVPLSSFWFSKYHEMRLATGLEMEDDWLVFDDEHFPHVKTDITSPGFAHGGAEVLLFDGPQFQSVLAEAE
jgi:hypothetical protein